MHHKNDKERKVIIAYDKNENINHVMNYKSYLIYYNKDLLNLLKQHWEYKTKFHNTKQLDLDI